MRGRRNPELDEVKKEVADISARLRDQKLVLAERNREFLERLRDVSDDWLPIESHPESEQVRYGNLFQEVTSLQLQVVKGIGPYQLEKKDLLKKIQATPRKHVEELLLAFRRVIEISETEMEKDLPLLVEVHDRLDEAIGDLERYVRSLG